MIKILPFIVVIILILGGLGVIAYKQNNIYNTFLETSQKNTLIFPIIPPTLIIDSKKPIEKLKFNTVSYKLPSKYDLNYERIKEKNKILNLRNILETYDYVIITTEDLTSAITSSTFLIWKTLIGYNVKIVKITDDEIANQPGKDLPEKIRNFLREYYMEWGIQYVLIIGNHATIPMRYCYPDPDNHRFDPFDYSSGEVPTDYYYADLSFSDSESWDLDGDGYYGEYGQDSPDFLAEVYVGRIPTNTLSRITYTLDKITTFEQDTGEWKDYALHAGAFFYFTNEGNSGYPAMDGAVISHYIEQDIMDGWTISHYSEQQGLEKSIYDWPALSESAFINDWRTGQYSIVNWQGHGWIDGVARKVWSWDDGDGIPEGNEISWPYFITLNSNLDDDYPSIVTAISCYVGCPEPAGGGNLGIKLLTDPSFGASIGVIASARTPYGSYDWPNTLGGSESIIYEFNRFLIDESYKLGEALYESKFYCNTNYGWDDHAEYIDMFTFNLFGDPSLVREGIYYENLPPEKPEKISGPTSGKPETEYNFKFVSNDPNNDQLKYQINWDDGKSDTTNLVDSGVPVEAKHTWQENDDFTITVVAIDEHGLESAPLSIIIPITKNKIFTYNLLHNYFYHFKDLFFTFRILL